MSAKAEALGGAGESKLSPQFHVAHHFDKADTQFDAGRMGVWLFLVTEILLFGGLFCAFAIFRSKYFPSFVEAHHHLDRVMGGINTIVLITSSFTMALAVRSAQKNETKKTTLLLAITLACAAMFLVVKYFEYSHKIHDGLLPGGNFTAADFASGHPGIFFAIYFMMTGIHGVHVVIGMGLILWILLRNQKSEFSSRYYAPVENVGLYWHLVDLVWIFLFPLLYLVG
ncbi:cytochrome c oxidase subunit 3 family protein [Polyangium sp. 6x1]|uniref:cytochrome c oxidase subunit 3 family protein n=1 Tax=Polyangium sp. 6x1 TaxID=3042689 RepID=UPI002482A9DC|nr:cytochrome c oxidase subunit 3 family protein [Polyangium sp. 6x1]MDI1445558.1 cytochrome c oxidase subunit 3 family protein [Polyangium sp. 6x1]